LDKAFFWGLDLTDKNGAAFPDEPYVQALASARARAAAKIGLPVGVETVLDERFDYHQVYNGEFSEIILSRGPVTEVTRMRLMYGNDAIFILPADWLRLDSWARRIQVVPTMAQAIPMQVTSYLFLNNFFTGMYGGFPDFFSVDYKAGLTGDAATMDPLLVDVIGKMAAVELLQQIGHLVGGAGIGSSSASLGGVSQSASYTKSGRSAFADRIDLWQKQIAEDLVTLRRNNLGIMVAVV
jgi:hypothetical protein